MKMLLILQLLFFILAAASGGRPRCGGVYTAARGILQTPGFPHSLPVPVNCEWIIDAQNLATANTSIIVYFTQLFVYEGLTFTEYQIYDKTYQLDGRIIHSVNETNVVQVRWIQSFQNFLVINLKLDTIDSAHLRVLDNFLDVYGFNITYEITHSNVRENACTMMDCGFTGICYDHYTKFTCDCFPGYSGPRCSSGPKSLCAVEGKPVCSNNGTCLHVGSSSIKCRCTSNFTGEKCETPVIPRSTKDCDTCVSSCSYDGNLENACKCKERLHNVNERIGFSCTMHLGNLPNLSGETLRLFIQNQIYRTLKMNYSKVEDLRVENLQYFRSGVDVTFRLFAIKKDEKRIRSILNKWSDRGYIANLTIAGKEFVFGPLLDLQSMSINHAGIVRQQDEFILSCVARGSPTITFRWFKDGIFVNITESISHKWTRLIKDPHIEDQYNALLGVERADVLDGGIFTCQVEDFGLQQCLSKRVSVREAPVIKVEPMSQTVKKGENFTIKCISTGNPTTKYSYSWTKNKELIPVRTNNEKYEVLYPGGSILQVFGIEKSVKYSCLIQDEAVSSELTVNINVIDPDLVRTCPKETYLAVEWPETAPDTDCIKICPRGYIYPGYIRRTCSLKDGINPVWLQPDYSQCTSIELYKIERDFQLMQLGYETATPIQILGNCLRYLVSRSHNGLFPGEGARILLLVRDVLFYTRRTSYNARNVSTIVFDVLDRILTNGNSLIDQEQLKFFQQVVALQLEISSSLLAENESHYNLSLSNIDLKLFNLNNYPEITFDSNNNSHINWKPSHLKIDLGKRLNTLVGVVVYRNLTAFLPKRSVIRHSDGAEIEYEVISQVIKIWLSHQERQFHNNKIYIEWHQKTPQNWTREGWYIQCAMAETAMYAYAWNTSICLTEKLNVTFTRCSCPGTSGTFVLLLTTNNVQVMSKQVNREESRPRKYIVLAGCSLCFLSGLICTMILLLHWILKRSCIDFLKFQCSTSVTGIMLVLVLVTIGEPPEQMYTNVITLMEIFVLMGMSAHLSTLLILYTELIQLPKTTTSKQTMIGISIGVPVITVFGSHLAHRTMDVKVQSWWLLAGSLAFYIFITVAIIIIIMFIFLYVTILEKLQKLSNIHDKEGKILHRRILLLKKSACVFCSITIVTISSIFYINFTEIIWCQYEFSIVTMILGLVLLICYVVKSESEFYFIHGRLKSKSREGFFGVDSVGSPLNFFTKEDAEVESESIPHRKSESQHIPKSIECFQMAEACKSGLPECVSSTMNDDSVYCDRSQIATRNDTIERYNRSPQLYRKSTFKITEEEIPPRCRSPDIIASKMCTELDLVASHAPSIVITPEESINQILATDSSNDWVPKRVQPEGREISTVSDKIIEIEPSVIVIPPTSDKLDGMLDRISHDLDYLLNRNDEEICGASSNVSASYNTGSLRKISKTPIPTVIQEVEEENEDDIKVPESITEISRTSC